MEQKEYYDGRAERYDRGTLFARENRNHMKKAQTISALLGMETLDLGGGLLLEVGTGSGIHAQYMLDHFKHIGYVGVDISRGMLQQAQRRLIGCPSLIVGAGESLPFDDDTFAAAYISGSLHHFRDPGKGFSEIVRVIRPGGRMVVMEPYWLFPTNLFYALISSEERGILSISESGMARWSAGTGLINVKLGHMLYTPPVPHALGGAYDAIDSILANIPLVRKASVMLYLYGEKGHMSEGVMRNEG